MAARPKELINRHEPTRRRRRREAHWAAAETLLLLLLLLFIYDNDRPRGENSHDQCYCRNIILYTVCIVQVQTRYVVINYVLLLLFFVFYEYLRFYFFYLLQYDIGSRAKIHERSGHFVRTYLFCVKLSFFFIYYTVILLYVFFFFFMYAVYLKFKYKS